MGLPLRRVAEAGGAGLTKERHRPWAPNRGVGLWAVRSDANSCSRVRTAPSVFDSSGAEVEGQRGEHVTTTKPAFQAVTSNRTASDLSACKWLRTPDVKPHTDNPERVGTSCHPVPPSRASGGQNSQTLLSLSLLSTRRSTYRLTDLTLTSLRVPTHTYCKDSYATTKAPRQLTARCSISRAPAFRVATFALL